MDEETKKYYFDLIYEKLYRITDSHIVAEEFVKDMAFGDVDMKDVLYYGDKRVELEDEISSLKQEVYEIKEKYNKVEYERNNLAEECDEYANDIMEVERFLRSLGYSIDDFRGGTDEEDWEE